MASRIKAITTYRPRIKKNSLVGHDQVADWFEERSLLTEGQARAVLRDLGKAAKAFLLNRQDVKIEGLGMLILDIGVDGHLRVSLKLEPDYLDSLDSAFNKDSTTITNVGNIGMTNEEIFDRWDEEHPDDLVER